MPQRSFVPDPEVRSGHERIQRHSSGKRDLLDLGEHRRRDLSGVEHLFQLRADGLATSFPLLKTVNAVPGNLPTQATSFVGRAEEISTLIELVQTDRLVTLTVLAVLPAVLP